MSGNTPMRGGKGGQQFYENINMLILEPKLTCFKIVDIIEALQGPTQPTLLLEGTKYIICITYMCVCVQ